MQVGTGYPGFQEITGKLFGHAFGQGGDQNPVTKQAFLSYFFHQVIDLTGHGSDFDGGIQKPRGTDHLFDHHPLAMLQFIISRGGTDVNNLRDQGLEFPKGQRAVVQGSR